MKYYEKGRPICASTGTIDKREAQRKLREREGQVAAGLYSGALVERTRFEDLVQGIRQDYSVNERKSGRWLEDFIKHLSVYFKRSRASAITTDQIKGYIAKRRGQEAANGTINRELACLKRMFRIATLHTPPLVARVPHIPMLEEHNIRSGYFTHEEFLAVRGALPDYAQVAVTLAYYTGMRIGEVLGLKWSQVDLVEAKVTLAPIQTKTEQPRVLYMTPDLYRVLQEAKRRRDEKYATCPWVCQRRGKPLERFRRTWKDACERVGLDGRLIHDFRRTAVRNMVRAGIPEVVAMAISGHKTRSVFDRYNIVNEADLKDATKRLAAYYEREKVTNTVTLGGLDERAEERGERQVSEEQGKYLVPPTRIERATRGLGNRCSIRLSYGGIQGISTACDASWSRNSDAGVYAI